jgi:transposase InsO family protein
MRPSMGRTGSCFDNAVAESFFASLKAEIGTRVFASRAEARREVFAYLNYYNNKRFAFHRELPNTTRSACLLSSTIALAA